MWERIRRDVEADVIEATSLLRDEVNGQELTYEASKERTLK